MQLKCPHCGALIPIENINIQEMLALCKECQQVFTFNKNTISGKTKRRKLKPPKHAHIHEDDGRLELSYRVAFGPGSKLGMVMSLFGLIIYSVIFIGASQGGAPLPFLIVVGLLFTLFAYFEAVFLTTTRHISLDEDEMAVTSGPLPFPIKDDKTLSVHEVTRVFFDRTTEAWPPLVPTHNVYAELQDGERVPVVTSLSREYARYIAYTLDDYLHSPEDDDAQEAAGAEASTPDSDSDLLLHETQAAHRDHAV